MLCCFMKCTFATRRTAMYNVVFHIVHFMVITLSYILECVL